MSIFVKLAGEQIATIQIVLVRGVITLLVTYLILLKKGIKPLGKNRDVLMIRGLVGSIALFLVYESLQRLSLSEATVIQYLYPIFTALFAGLILSEHISKKIFFSIISGLIGVYITLDFPILNIGDASRMDIIISLSGAILTGLSYVMVKKASNLKESPYVIMFYFPLFTVPLSMLFLTDNWVMPSTLIWAYLIVVGISSQFGQIFLTYGYELLPASRAAMTSYLQVPFSVIAGIIIFEDVITPNFIFGTTIILFTILMMIKRDKVNNLEKKL
jgi:drug/metabolite transporter (DMT)-like permease